jgi:hypothetical protein
MYIIPTRTVTFEYRVFCSIWTFYLESVSRLLQHEQFIFSCFYSIIKMAIHLLQLFSLSPGWGFGDFFILKRMRKSSRRWLLTVLAITPDSALFTTQIAVSGACGGVEGGALPAVCCAWLGERKALIAAVCCNHLHTPSGTAIRAAAHGLTRVLSPATRAAFPRYETWRIQEADHPGGTRLHAVHPIGQPSY